MIGPSPSHLEEIVVVLSPRLSRSGIDRYDAKIYAAPSVALPLTTTRDGAPIEELPLRGVESVRVGWTAYRDFLAMFHEGEKTAAHMRDRLFEAVSPGLKRLLDVSSGSPRRTRIWWSCESPEIEELPWELLGASPASEVSFVRGLPAPPRALIPRVGASLRLAIIARRPHDVGLLGLDKPIPGVELAFESDDRPVRHSLATVARAGIELVHIVADGWTLPSWDTMLEFDGEPPLSPAEIGTRLRSSRVVALGLSPPSEPKLGDDGPTVYRAFSHVPGAIDSTSVVAQLGPWPHATRPLFPLLYGELARTGSVEAALRAVRAAGEHAAPIALYLRQRLGRELAMGTRSASPQEPQQVQTHVDVASELMAQLKAVESRHQGIAAPLSRSATFQRHERNVEQLSTELEAWTKLEDDER